MKAGLLGSGRTREAIMKLLNTSSLSQDGPCKLLLCDAVRQASAGTMSIVHSRARVNPFVDRVRIPSPSPSPSPSPAPPPGAVMILQVFGPVSVCFAAVALASHTGVLYDYSQVHLPSMFAIIPKTSLHTTAAVRDGFSRSPLQRSWTSFWTRRPTLARDTWLVSRLRRS
jgi:hypothetical protein